MSRDFEEILKANTLPGGERLERAFGVEPSERIRKEIDALRGENDKLKAAIAETGTVEQKKVLPNLSDEQMQRIKRLLDKDGSFPKEADKLVKVMKALDPKTDFPEPEGDEPEPELTPEKKVKAESDIAGFFGASTSTDVAESNVEQDESEQTAAEREVCVFFGDGFR